jgi:hypothetical protein
MDVSELEKFKCHVTGIFMTETNEPYSFAVMSNLHPSEQR